MWISRFRFSRGHPLNTATKRQGLQQLWLQQFRSLDPRQ